MATLTYHQFLAERFKNLLPKDDDQKEIYKDQVWSIIQATYASIGGIKGSGFNSVDDMVKNVPFWKLIIRDGIVHGVILYKDKGGRKMVALGYDGSEYGKKFLFNAIKQEIGRAFTEISKGALAVWMKLIPWDILKNFIHTPEQVQKQLPKKTIIPVRDIPFQELPKDGQMTLKKYPHLKPYAYVRELDGVPFFKVMIGTAGISIK